MGSQQHEEAQSDAAVIMVPLPSQSHLNRLLQLAVLISSYGIPVHFVGSVIHNRQVKLRATALPPDSIAGIHFHDFPTPSLTPSVLADDSPMHHLAVAQAYMSFRRPVGVLAQELSTKARRVVAICDMHVVEAVGDAVSLPKVEYYVCHLLSAISTFYIMSEVMGKTGSLERGVKEALPEQMISYLKWNLPEHYGKRAGDIYNSTRLMEGRFIDLMEKEGISGNGMTQWAVGANLVAEFTSKEGGERSRHECLEWLDRQAPKSVIYVSFGSNVSFSGEEARELAIGLEESRQKFIWVVKAADKADIFASDKERVALPEGFEERVGEDGMVVRDWAPQPEILAHKAVGGFMSHCGWNSCLESLTMGVPVAAWPMSVDQPLNAVLLAEILKVGLIVRDWGRREEQVKAAAIKSAVERLMATEEGEEIRERAEELGSAIQKSMEEVPELNKETSRPVIPPRRKKKAGKTLPASGGSGNSSARTVIDPPPPPTEVPRRPEIHDVDDDDDHLPVSALGKIPAAPSEDEPAPKRLTEADVAEVYISQEITRCLEHVKSLERAYTRRGASVREIERKRAEAEEEVTTLKEKLSPLEEENNCFRADNTRLNAENLDLQQKLAISEASLASVKACHGLF